jgi:hypothetical protein
MRKEYCGNHKNKLLKKKADFLHIIIFGEKSCFCGKMQGKKIKFFIYIHSYLFVF